MQLEAEIMLSLFRDHSHVIRPVAHLMPPIYTELLRRTFICEQHAGRMKKLQQLQLQPTLPGNFMTIRNSASNIPHVAGTEALLCAVVATGRLVGSCCCWKKGCVCQACFLKLFELLKAFQFNFLQVLLPAHGRPVSGGGKPRKLGCVKNL